MSERGPVTTTGPTKVKAEVRSTSDKNNVNAEYGNDFSNEPAQKLSSATYVNSKKQYDNADFSAELQNQTTAENNEPYKNNAKIFVGNLPYEATKAQLEEIFKDVGEIIEVNMVELTRKPMGFGFVTFKNHEDAQTAIKTLNNYQFDSRSIVVELAKDKSNSNYRNFRGRRNIRGRGRGLRPYYGNSRNVGQMEESNYKSNDKARIDDSQNAGDDISDQSESENVPVPNQSQPEYQFIQTEQPKIQEHIQDAQIENDDIDADYAQQENDDESQEQQKSQQMSSANRNRNIRNKGRGRGRDRSRFQNRDPENSRYSPTTLFVSNLPYQLTSDELSSVFGEYNVVNVSIMSNRDGQSKGFGFVELASHDEQMAILNDVRSIRIGGRDIIIKCARSSRFDSQPNKKSNGFSNNSPSDPQNQQQPDVSSQSPDQ